MTLNIIDRRSTVNVQSTTKEYAFQYQGKTYRRSTLESLHDFFLKHTTFNTVKLRFPNQKYYLHFALDESEKFTNKKDLRRVLSQESQGAWIEEKNGKQRYFVDKGWVFSKIEEVSEEEFFSNHPSTLAQKVVSLIGTVALGALALGSQVPRRASHPSSVGFVSSVLFQATSVFAQIPVDGEFMVNTNMTDIISSYNTARLEGRGFVTVWDSDQAGGYDVYARIFNATGGPTGIEFRCNSNITGNQRAPAVAGLVGGGFVIVWGSDQTGDYDVYARIFNITQEPISPEFRCNTNVAGNQNVPVVAGLEGGDFVVGWQSGQPGDFDIYARIFNATSEPITSEFRCNTIVISDQYDPAVARLLGGGFVVVWNGYQGANDDIYGRVFNATYAPIGLEFRCNTNTSDGQYSPAVAGLITGGFAVSWEGYQTGDANIYAQIFNATYEPVGLEFRCNTNTTDGQYSPAVAGLNTGGFAVSWEGYQTGDANIYAQIFNATYEPVGLEFRCNTNTTGGQFAPRIAELPDGGFVIVWSGTQTGISKLYGQRYEISNNSILSFSQSTTDSSSLTTPLSSFISTSQVTSLTQASFPNSSSSIILSPSSSPTTMLISSSSSPQTSTTILSITTLSYETTYSITVNGLNVGSFMFQGGTGLIDGTQSNTIMLNIDDGLIGETLTLFTIPAGQEGEFQTIELVGESCQSFESQIVQDGTEQTFQVVLQITTCSTAIRSQGIFLKA